MARRQTPQTHQCIYCRELKPVGAFNREHVLSEAFGHFNDTLVLHKTVCKDCNTHFDRQLERRYTRGSVETLLRFETGLKELPAPVVKLPFVEVTLPPDHDWHGIRLGLRMEGKLRIHVFPQAAFLEKESGRWIFLTSYEIDRGALKDTTRFDLSKSRVFGEAQSDRKAVLEQLRDLGITFENWADEASTSGGFDGQDLPVEITITVNKGIRRCVAKYAFNYLAHECGKQFALNSAFDAARSFIRYGTEPTEQLVREKCDLETVKWFGDNQPGDKAHELSVWCGPHDSILGHVSLFGCMHYDVLLAPRYDSVLLPVSSCHRYHLGTLTLQRVPPSPVLPMLNI